MGDTDKAVELLEGVLEGLPAHVDDELVNLYAELCLALRLFTDAFRVGPRHAQQAVGWVGLVARSQSQERLWWVGLCCRIGHWVGGAS